MPNSERNTSVIAPLAALKRGFLKKRMSSIGWLECSSQTKNPPRTHEADDEAGEDLGRRSNPCVGASMIAHRIEPSATIDRTAPTGSSAAWDGSLRLGHEEEAEHEADDHDRHVHDEDRAPPEVLEQERRR